MKTKQKIYLFTLIFIVFIGILFFIFNKPFLCYMKFQQLKIFRKDNVKAMNLARELSNSECGIKYAIKDVNVFGGKTRGWSSKILLETNLESAVDSMENIVAKTDANVAKKLEIDFILWQRSKDIKYLMNIFELTKKSSTDSMTVKKGRLLLNSVLRNLEVEFEVNENPDVDIEVTKDDFVKQLNSIENVK